MTIDDVGRFVDEMFRAAATGLAAPRPYVMAPPAPGARIERVTERVVVTTPPAARAPRRGQERHP